MHILGVAVKIEIVEKLKAILALRNQVGLPSIYPKLRSPSWIFIGQPVSFGRTSDIPTATAAYLRIRSPLTFWRSDTPLFPIFNCQRLHATIDRPFHPSACRNELYTTGDSRVTLPPLRALLIPRGALFPCTQNALLRAGVEITDIIRGCKLSWEDHSWYQSNYEERSPFVLQNLKWSSENSIKLNALLTYIINTVKI